MPRISITISEEESKLLKKRAKKNYLSLREQIEDIIRRSVVRGKKGTKRQIKVDDKLVAVFSREKRGGWKRKKNRKSVKK